MDEKKEKKADTAPECTGCTVKKEFCQGCIINIQEKILREIQESESCVAFTW